MATFATYVLVSESHYLDAGKAFVALSLFNILRFPINLLPMMVSLVVQVFMLLFYQKVDCYIAVVVACIISYFIIIRKQIRVLSEIMEDP